MDDDERIIIHFDADCFYAQVEEINDPTLKSKPLAVTQKFLVVTCNYNARKMGVSKLMSIKESKRRCPNLTLINGEDLTPYRRASQDILKAIQIFGPTQRNGLDEFTLDATEEVAKRMNFGCRFNWKGYVHVPSKKSFQIASANGDRTLELRADITEPSTNDLPYWLESKQSTKRLKTGSMVADDIRRAVHQATGIRTSAGISNSFLLSKLISGLHKPNEQTSLCMEHAEEFMADLPLRCLPTVGNVFQNKLHEHGLYYVKDFSRWTEDQLIESFGKQGSFLHLARKGKDKIVIADQEAKSSKQVSVEDSFRECSGFSGVNNVLNKLIPDLLFRLEEFYHDHKRRPRTLTVTWRHKSRGNMARSSASIAYPNLDKETKSWDSKIACLKDSAMHVLQRELKEPFYLTLINVSARNFHYAESEQLKMVATLPAKPSDLVNVLLSNKDNASKLSARLQRESVHRHRIHDIQEDDDSFWHDISDLSEMENKRHQGSRKRGRETLSSKSKGSVRLDSYFSKTH